MSTKEKTAEEQAVETMGIGKVSQSELDKAKKEGVLEAAREDAKASFRYATDGQLPAEPTDRQYVGWDEIMPWADLLDLGIDTFTDRIKDGADNPVPEEKVYGLLALERNGQNRTDFVKAMMKRLGLKADELPGGGPDYTNDTTPITKL